MMRYMASPWLLFVFKLLMIYIVARGSESSVGFDWRKSTATRVENSRDLCLQAIQEAMFTRTDDIFVDVYKPVRFQRPFILYLLAEHSNNGDTFIDRGEEMWLARHGIQPAAECTNERVNGQHHCDEEEIVDLLKENATVLFHGGGNWGDIWFPAHRERMDALKYIAMNPGMTLVTMPQSLQFNSESKRKASEQEVAQIMAVKSEDTRIVFLFRQRDSYLAAQKMYPGVDIRLVPDAAFMIGPLPRVSSNEKFKYDILFLLRNDKESSNRKGKFLFASQCPDITKRVKSTQKRLGTSGGADVIHSTMAKIAPDLSYYVGDWRNNPTNRTLYYYHKKDEPTTPSMRHSVILDASIRYFSTGKVIVCNRLHASILALLMNTPHVIIDGGVDTASYGKRLATRSAAFETSEHCTQDSLRFKEASTIEEGTIKGLELYEKFFA